MIRAAVLALGLGLAARSVSAHGQMNFPPSTRQGLAGKTWPGALSGQGAGGYCEQPNSENKHNPLNGACMLFSQPNVKQPKISIIPGEPTLNAAQYRTNNVNVSSGPNDWTRTKPWRSPGAAPVLGSGCGVAGGGIMWNNNGGWPPTGMKLGQDPVEVLPGPKDGPVTLWQSGSTQTVAMGVWANHGGGYSYRLCKNVEGKVTEECTSLSFCARKTVVADGRRSCLRLPAHAAQVRGEGRAVAAAHQRHEVPDPDDQVDLRLRGRVGADSVPDLRQHGGQPAGARLHRRRQGRRWDLLLPGRDRVSGAAAERPAGGAHRVWLLQPHRRRMSDSSLSWSCFCSFDNWLTAAALRNRHGGQVPRLQHRRSGPNP